MLFAAQKEYDVLHERSRAVTEREKQLTAREDRLQQTIDADVRQQMSLREQVRGIATLITP